MSFGIRLRAWRARRSDRKAEKLIGLSEKPKGYVPDIQGQLDKLHIGADLGEHSSWTRSAGEGFKRH